MASAMDAKFEHEYLVKFKTMSYVHVQWLTAQEIGELVSTDVGVQCAVPLIACFLRSCVAQI